MNSLDSLMGMVLQEAVEGNSGEHYFDESRNRIPSAIPERRTQPETELPPIHYTLELIKDAEGNYHWTE